MTKNEIECKADRIERIARKYAWQEYLRRNSALVQNHIPQVIEQIASISKQCPDPKLRLEAARDLLKLKELFCEQQERIYADYYQGNMEVLEALAALPQTEQRNAALQMYARQQLSRVDLDAVMKLVAGSELQHIEEITAAYERAVRMIEGREDLKPIVNGVAQKAAN